MTRGATRLGSAGSGRLVPVRMLTTTDENAKENNFLIIGGKPPADYKAAHGCARKK